MVNLSIYPSSTYPHKTPHADSNGVVVDGINKRRGTTEERESLDINKEENIGFIFFDTSLKKYVMWDAAWKILMEVYFLKRIYNKNYNESVIQEFIS